MGSLRWRKQQDFCLRLGLLKAVVRLVGVSRGSSTRAWVIRRLDEEVFVSLASYPEVREEIVRMIGTDIPKREKSGRDRIDNLATGLLVLSGSESWGQPLRDNVSYKLLDWAQSIGFLGGGLRVNQRGALLHSLFADSTKGRLTASKLIEWNPFVISNVEVAFLLYHILDVDELTGGILVAAGLKGEGSNFEAEAARLLTSEQLDLMLPAFAQHASVSDLKALRVLKNLAAVIRWETGRGDRPRARGAPRPTKKPGRQKGVSGKNADHQAIPRFEQLTDLGFFEKDVREGLTGAKLIRARNAWNYRVTGAAVRFAKAVGSPDKLSDPNWSRENFARAMGSTGFFGEVRPATSQQAVRLLVQTYEDVHRRVGHTPFKSLALMAMISGLSQGLTLEIGALHELLMLVKTGRALEDQIFFAAGNKLDRMFVKFGPGVEPGLNAWIAEDPAARWPAGS